MTNKQAEIGIKIAFMAAILGYFGFTIKFFNDATKQINQDIADLSVKEGIVLKKEITSEIYGNKQDFILKNVIIDTNNNGIEDADDIIIDGEEFTYPGPKESSYIIVLQNEHFKKPLATKDENGNLNIKNKPSDFFSYYMSQNERIKNLDNEFNKMLNQKSR